MDSVFGSTCQRLHFGDKSSPDSCSGVQITLVRCLTSSMPPQTKIVARTAVSCRLRSKTPCNCHETDGFGHPTAGPKGGKQNHVTCVKVASDSSDAGCAATYFAVREEGAPAYGKCEPDSSVVRSCEYVLTCCELLCVGACEQDIDTHRMCHDVG